MKPTQNNAWWVVSTHLKNMLVKRGIIFLKVRGENKKNV